MNYVKLIGGLGNQLFQYAFAYVRLWKYSRTAVAPAWLLLPLALCLGMHFLMHRHVGHDQRDRDE